MRGAMGHSTLSAAAGRDPGPVHPGGGAVRSYLRKQGARGRMVRALPLGLRRGTVGRGDGMGMADSKRFTGTQLAARRRELLLRGAGEVSLLPSTLVVPMCVLRLHRGEGADLGRYGDVLS